MLYYIQDMRILIIDDEQDVRNLLTETLKAEGFAIDSAPDGEQGEYLALCNEYDVIVLDNRLPKKSGIDVVQTLRAHNLDVPILILSAIFDTQQKSDVLNSGADDYLTKPYSFEELLARIRALLRRPKKIEEDILTIDDLVLDTKRHTVHRNAHVITLTLKEFSLLEYLMRNAGIVMTRGMLMEHVWNMDVDPFSNTIDSHIASLRRKIEPAGTHKLIVTIPGRGYKIYN